MRKMKILGSGASLELWYYPGVYFVVLRSEGKVLTERLVKAE